MPSPITGPSSAHSGLHYLYAETSGKEPGDVFSLSYRCPQGFAQQVDWWYHMHGATIGSLVLKEEGLIMWSKFGNHGQIWQPATALLSGTSPTVTFEATRGSSFTGDIAIDDASVSCMFVPPSPPTLPSPSLPPHPPPSPPSPPNLPLTPSQSFDFDGCAGYSLVRVSNIVAQVCLIQ